MAATRPLTRREIMKKLDIKSKTTFRTMCKNGNVMSIGHKIEGHVITFLYSPDSVDKIRKAIKEGDRRKWQ